MSWLYRQGSYQKKVKNFDRNQSLGRGEHMVTFMAEFTALACDALESDVAPDALTSDACLKCDDRCGILGLLRS